MRLEGLKFKTEDKDEITIIVDVFADFKEMEFRIADVMIRHYRKRNATSLKSKITDEYRL